MKRHLLAALAVVLSLTVGIFVFAVPGPVEAQCLDRSACSEIEAEIADLRPDLRDARHRLQQLQRALASLSRGSERWIAKRSQVKRAKRAFRRLKRELKALKHDFRHQGCASC